jgi:hypothetical protein
MPFCPKCRYEYRPEISECPDCNEKLVATMPPDPDEFESPDNIDDWVPIARMTSPQYAEMIVEALRNKEIPAIWSSTSGHFGVTGAMGTSSHQPIPGAGNALHVPKQLVVDACHEVEAILGEDWEKIRLIDLED